MTEEKRFKSGGEARRWGSSANTILKLFVCDREERKREEAREQ